MMNLLEPWVLLRLAAGLVATVLFARGAWTALKVLRHFEVSRASEGQLALERQMELSWTFVRVATIVQVGALVLTVLAADRLSASIRGAMCAYGVFNANEAGFPALSATITVALAAGVLAQVYAFDARVRGLELARPVAWLTVAMAPLAAIDFAFNARFLGTLDLSVVASCCSAQLDVVAPTGLALHQAHGLRVITTMAALALVGSAAAAAFLVSRRPTAWRALLAGALGVAALPVALTATVVEVAPHAFEVPQHACPFCLLRPSVLGMGYPLFAAIFLAVVWGAGAAVCGFLSRDRPAIAAAFAPFARGRLVREALAWTLALALGAAPVLRYAIVSGGASLFQ
jgi:hypothetical protein